MAVQGVGFWVEGVDGVGRLHILVTADDRVRIRTVRDETVTVVAGDRAKDLDWQVDQYTQETIGVTLAAEGWEAFSIASPQDSSEPAPGASPVYLVRQG